MPTFLDIVNDNAYGSGTPLGKREDSMSRIRTALPDTIILGACLALAACGGEPEADLPLGTAQQMMAGEVQPAADVYWQSVRSVSELVDGEPVFTDFRPETDAEWEEVRAAAARLGELGAIMQQPGYAEGRGDDWIVFSQGLVDLAGQAEEAAVAQDPDAVFEAGGLVYNVCQACHLNYPPANMPEGVEESEIRPAEGVTLEDYVEGT